MKKINKILFSVAFLAIAASGAITMNKGNLSPEQEAYPVVRIGIGMNPEEVIKKSTYPLDFSSQDQAFADQAFKYGNVVATADVDFEIVAPHAFLIKNVRYWGIRTELDEVNAFDGDVPKLTIDEAILRAKQWVANVESAGWVRKIFLYANSRHQSFSDWETLREAFLFSGDSKIIGVDVGSWHSVDNKQEVSISIEHKRADGGPRNIDTPASKGGENDKTYMLSFSVGYTDEVREYRGKNIMELRKEALKKLQQ